MSDFTSEQRAILQRMIGADEPEVYVPYARLFELTSTDG